MNSATVDYSKIADVSDNGVRLFKVMMRLEFALKDRGYLKTHENDKDTRVEIDWDQFANKCLGKEFWLKVKEFKEIATLIDTPPKHQIRAVSGNLDWEDAKPVTNIQELIGAVKRVRNNLFHGGKSGDPDRGRNEALYLCALFVIEQILLEDDHLHTIFSGNY